MPLGLAQATEVESQLSRSPMSCEPQVGALLFMMNRVRVLEWGKFCRRHQGLDKGLLVAEVSTGLHSMIHVGGCDCTQLEQFMALNVSFECMMI
jgi:hypothetical protein